MSYDVISNWVERAKAEEIVTTEPGGILVIKRVEPQMRAKAIMAIADKLWPWYMQLFEGTRDKNGMIVHPSRIRALAINVAQSILKDQE